MRDVRCITTFASLALLAVTTVATAQPNDLCANATAVNSDTVIAFDTTNANTDGPDDPANPCNSASADTNVWKDVWYLYTAGGSGSLTISCCLTATFDSKIIAYDTTSCDGATQIANTILCNEDCAEDGTFFTSTLQITVTGGQQILVRLGGFSNAGDGSDAQFGAGDLSFLLEQGCTELNCEPGDTPEVELCLQDLNGGCNSTPPAFQDIVAGESVCGTVWADDFDSDGMGNRDTDWYFLTSGAGTITVFSESLAPTVTFVIDGVDDCMAAVIGTIGHSENCISSSTASAVVTDGNYVIFKGSGVAGGGGVFEGYPCSTGPHNYRFTVDAPEPSACFGATGDCEVDNGSPGCDNFNCCFLVCESDPACCDISWDADCASAAVKECLPCNIGEGDCFQNNGTPGCDDQACCELVCSTPPPAGDPFCCDVSWDTNCADLALALCDACPTPCQVQAQGGDGLEGEDCGLDTNGGCNSTPTAFGAITVGGAVAGTAWADGGARDTDWYLFDAGAGGDFTLTLDSEFEGQVFFVDGLADCVAVIVGETGASTSCGDSGCATATLAANAAGYVAFASNSGFAGNPCCIEDGSDNTNRYRMSLSSGLNCGGGTCPGDIAPFPGGDGVVDVLDLVDVILNWGMVGPAGDADGSGLVDVNDLVLVILNWGACP